MSVLKNCSKAYPARICNNPGAVEPTDTTTALEPMTKRRLSNQQQARISERHQRELVSGNEAGGARESSDGVSGERCNGRIVSHLGQQLLVETLEAGSSSGTSVRCFQRANLPALVTGDLVVWEAGDNDTGVITAVAERKSVFGRPAFSGNFKPMAANIDRVLLVIAPLPEPFPNLIDRYLVAIETLQLQAVLVLNKSDLHAEIANQRLDKLLSLYEGLGYETHRVSTVDNAGIAPLLASLSGLTTVIVGQSGVGKSSLINSFGVNNDAAVGSLSTAGPKGTHTTTTARLFHLPDCDLIDSPGIRELSLGHIDASAVFAGFREFRQFEGQCKFRDCSHQTEPDCALNKALAAGAISPQRVDSYFQILQSLDNAGR